MLRKSILLFALINFVFAITPTTSQQARLVAENFIANEGQEYSVVEVRVLDGEGLVLGYVCDIEPQGFIFVSPAREIEPVIAFSLAGDFSFDNSKDNILLDMVTLDMKYRLAAEDITDQTVIENNRQMWETYLDNQRLARLMETMTTFGPLTDTEWSQSSPYFNSCPVDPQVGTNCVTGCVATALAQLINYWEYPPSVTFDSWDSYTSRCDPEDGHGERVIEIDAPAASMPSIDYNGSGSHPTTDIMADLLYAAGVSVEMKYSSEGSSTYTSKCASALRNDWDYDDADVFSDINATFYSTLQENLRHGKPALLSIFRAEYSVGHAIVCDGYRDTDDLYHVNYGWGGYYCGPSYWYSLPDGLPSDFIILHQGILNVTPPPSECESDAPDNCSEAMELVPTSTEQTKADKIDSDDDEDWFVMQLQEDVEYTFYTTGPTDTYAELYSYCGGSSVTSSDAGGEGENFHLVFTPSSTGDYFLRIPGYYYSPADSYTLHYSASSFIPPSLTVDYPDGGETLDEGEEIEIYWLSEGVPAISQVKIEFSTTGPFGSFTTITERTENDGSHTWLVPTVDADETDCIIKITDADDSGVFDKSDFEFTIADVTLPDPSSNCYLAMSLPMSESESTREDAIDPIGDTDWYSFNLTAGRSYSFSATGETDTYGEFYSSCSGSSIAVSDDDGEGLNFSLDITPETSGTYMLKVRGYSETETTGPYVLHWQDNGITDAPDNCSSALALTISSDEAARPDALSGEYEQDWFEFELEAGIDYHFYTTGSTDTYAEIYDYCGGDALLSDDDGGSGTNCHLTFRPDITTTYYLMIWGYWEGPGDENYELRYYENVPEILVISPEGGEDVFEGSELTIEWLTESVPGYENLTIDYSTSGPTGPWTETVSSTENDGVHIWEAADVTGIENNCYIRIYDPDRPATSDVSDAAFTIKDIPPEEGGDACGTATVIVPTETEQTFPECLAPTGDVDYYQVFMTEGALYTFYTSGNTDTYAEIYDDCIMPRLAYNDDGGFEFNCRIDFAPTVTGTYYLAIKGYSEEVTGDYTLHYIYDPTGGMDIEENALPTRTTLSVSPNPFNGACHIDAPTGENVIIFDGKGREIERLGASRTWRPGKDIPSGKYLIRTGKGEEATAIYMK